MKGRAIDLLVGKALLRLRIVRKKSGHSKFKWKYRLHDVDGCHVGTATGFFGWGWHATPSEAWAECPPYSTDMGHAWDVWKVMSEDRETFETFIGWICRLTKDRLPMSLRNLNPAVICKAALRSRGIKLKPISMSALGERFEKLLRTADRSLLRGKGPQWTRGTNRLLSELGIKAVL